MSRQELIGHFSLHQRDLRPLILLNQTPTILTRPSCYIVNLGFLRMIIGEDEAIIFNTDHKYISGHFVEDLSTRLDNKHKHKQSRFEYMVLESALHVKMDKVMSDYGRLAESIEESFSELQKNQPTNELLERLLARKKRLSRLQTTVEQLQKLLHEILDDDEELQAFVFATTSRDAEEEEIESIIEHYDEQVDQVLNKIFDLRENIEDTQAIINLKMANIRNALIRLDLFFTIFASALALPALIAGIFGMNIANSFEGSVEAFLAICGVIIVLVFSIFIWAWRALRRTRNI